MKNPIIERLKPKITNRVIMPNGELQLTDDNLRNYPKSNRDLDKWAVYGYITTRLGQGKGNGR